MRGGGGEAAAETHSCGVNMSFARIVQSLTLPKVSRVHVTYPTAKPRGNQKEGIARTRTRYALLYAITFHSSISLWLWSRPINPNFEFATTIQGLEDGTAQD